MPTDDDASRNTPHPPEPDHDLSDPLPPLTPAERIIERAALLYEGTPPAEAAAVYAEAAALGITEAQLLERASACSSDRAATLNLDNEADVAKTFLRLFGRDWRVLKESNQCMRWSGTRWELLTPGNLLDEVGDYLNALGWTTQTLKQVQRNRLGSTALARSVTAKIVNARRMQVSVSVFDSHPHLIGVEGGVVDLRTGQTREGRRSDLVSRALAIAPAADAECPRFEAFMREIMLDRQDLVDYVLDFFAGALIGKVLFDRLLFFIGTGRNGKSVLLNVMEHIFGEYAARLSDRALLKQPNGATPHPTELMPLVGARLAVISELPAQAKWDDARVKVLASSEKMTARGISENFTTWTPTHSLVIAANKAPTFDDASEGLKARLRLVPFDLVVPFEQRNVRLADQLKEEAPGILAMLIARCTRICTLDAEPAPPTDVLLRTQKYSDEVDPVAAFLRDYCIRGPGFATATGDLFRAFKALIPVDRPINPVWFGRKLTEHNVEPHRTGREKMRKNIRLTAEGSAAAAEEAAAEAAAAEDEQWGEHGYTAGSGRGTNRTH